jgi:diguanylate cyclase (GGDEF)-like protein
MDLDIRTIMVMFSMLAFMFFWLLELAGLHVGNIRGVRQWAVANLCISFGLSLAYFFISPTLGHNWAIVISAMLISAGISLQFTGIQAFKEEHSDWRIVSLVVCIALFQNVWFGIFYPDMSARAIANSLLFAIVYAACARALLIRVDSPLKTAYWFTGSCFVVLVVVMLVRSIVIWLSLPESYGIYVNTPVNPLSFFIACMVQFCVIFGFLLMLNYRLITDLQKLASCDALTGALNRRRLEEEATRLKARCLRTGETLAVMMIDIDHFKLINDLHGHLVGDEVLRNLADIAQNSIRTDDYFARYGGEEFCILLRSKTEDEAWNLAERLRQDYAKFTLNVGGKSVKITVSIGVADSTSNGLEFTSLVSAADQALYRAKQEGRNQVVSYSSLN